MRIATPLYFKIEEYACHPEKRAARDLEKTYTTRQFVAKLRRLADALETGKDFRIQIASERVRVPGTATFNIEHERGKSEEEIEFQLKWKLDS